MSLHMASTCSSPPFTHQFTYSHRERRYIKANERDHGAHGSYSGGSGGSLAGRDSDNTHDELGGEHESATSDKDAPTSKFLYNIERDWRGAHIDQCRDQLDEEGVGDSTKRFEEDHAEVQDEVDTLEKFSISMCFVDLCKVVGRRTVSCWRACRIIATVVRRALELPLKIEPLKQFVQPAR